MLLPQPMGGYKRSNGFLPCFGVPIFVLVAVASALQKDVMDNKSNIVGCIPSSQKLLLSSYFNKHDVLVDSTYEEFLVEDYQLISSGKELPNLGNYYIPKISISTRNLHGEGSHRQLVTSFVFENSAPYRRDFESCKAIIVERLPLGIFADAFELQRLAQRGVFSDVAVFGDTNLELPSALSNRSAVEIHMDILRQTLSNSSRWPDLSVALPLHVRYPPLDMDSYWNVKIGEPDLLLSCTPATNFSDDCSSLLIRFYPNNSSDVVWKVPCGNGEHTVIVSIFTFASALVSALLIVYSTLFSLQKHTKIA